MRLFGGRVEVGGWYIGVAGCWITSAGFSDASYLRRSLDYGGREFGPSCCRQPALIYLNVARGSFLLVHLLCAEFTNQLR